MSKQITETDAERLTRLRDTAQKLVEYQWTDMTVAPSDMLWLLDRLDQTEKERDQIWKVGRSGFDDLDALAKEAESMPKSAAQTCRFIDVLNRRNAHRAAANRYKQAADLLYKLARHIRNTDKVNPFKWGVQAMELLGEVREIQPARYDTEVKSTAEIKTDRE
jgi:hypothetical protein